ncbi:MAG TPA: glycoside hydrolase family 3 protein [Steroidobacteraceae bacterium]|jgi:beta-glucosidase
MLALRNLPSQCVLGLLCCLSAAAADAGGGVAHAALWPRSRSVGLIDAASERQVSQIMQRMSLEEEVGQTIQADIAYITPEDLRHYALGAVLAGGTSAPAGGTDRTPAAWLALARALRAASLEQRPGHTPIPILFASDAVHGNNAVAGATIFPQNIGLGAAHDPALIGRIGEATAQEMAAVGFDWAFAPALAVPRDLRWGRSYESYSQDPTLVRRYAGELVRGLQGEPGGRTAMQSGHVAATAKHFLGDGGTRDGVDQGDTEVSEQQLIEVDAQGYLSAIDAGVMSVMASFSSWQGVKVHGNASLLTGVLKGRLGFDGIVVSDWNGHAQIPGCSTTDCAAALTAGIDMVMAPDGWRALFDHTLAQVRAGVIARSRLDDAVRRILRVKLRLGVFDAARPWEGRPDVLASAAHRALARTAVRESLVLLKNQAQLLPLRSTAHVLVAGDGADDIGRQCGGWTLGWQGGEHHNSDFPQAESIYAGLRAALVADGGSAELALEGRYSVKPQVAIVVFGERPYAEGAGDLRSIEYQAADRRDLALLLRLRAEHVPVVSVFLSGRPLALDPEIDASDAFVAAWLPGSEGGGIADLLIGDAHGAARYQFRGTLSFAWPARAAASAKPEFGLGYGLHYPAHTPGACNPSCPPD